MPIYAYRCESCGHSKDVLQKISDPLLTECPACGESTFAKQLTAAGFQLKGSGWYATDFRSSNSGGAPRDEASSKPEAPKSDGGAAESAGSSGKAEATSTAAASCAGPCACH